MPLAIMASRQWTRPIDAATSQVPSRWALTVTDAACQYAQELWAKALQLPGAPEPACDSSVLDDDFQAEIEHLVRAYVFALSKQCE